MRFLTDSTVDFDLLETLRFDEGGGYHLLDRHLARLAATAERFSFAFDREAVRRLLDEQAQSFTGPHQRVRLTLSRDGRANVTSQPLTLPSSDAVYRVALAETRLDPLYLFLYHKTTNRAFYDEERVKLAAATGCDEVIFLNTRGELTEGSFTTLFLEMEPGGILYTPALTSGLLAGTLREELLAQKRAEEAVLTLADLAMANTIWLGNSVRGLVRAELIGGLPSEDQDARPETAFSP
jgi:para-aminobenzoate synthetase/4-amino-4-deoxychorismate lyase